MCEVSETFFISLAKPKAKKVEKEQSVIAGHPVLNYSFVDKLWSFEIAGGKDQNAPLTVISVKKNGLAKRSGIKVGDEIMFINNMPTDDMTLLDAQMEIQESGRSLKIIVRGWGLSRPLTVIIVNSYFVVTPMKAVTAAKKTRQQSTFGLSRVSVSLEEIN